MMLFGAMRTALATGQQDLSKALGEQFRKEFPQHEFAGNVNTLLLENVFFSKQYEAGHRTGGKHPQAAEAGRQRP
jgi:hypothetical protein